MLPGPLSRRDICWPSCWDCSGKTASACWLLLGLLSCRGLILPWVAPIQWLEDIERKSSEWDSYAWWVQRKSPPQGWLWLPLQVHHSFMSPSRNPCFLGLVLKYGPQGAGHPNILHPPLFLSWPRGDPPTCDSACCPLRAKRRSPHPTLTWYNYFTARTESVMNWICSLLVSSHPLVPYPKIQDSYLPQRHSTNIRWMNLV